MPRIVNRTPTSPNFPVIFPMRIAESTLRFPTGVKHGLNCPDHRAGHGNPRTLDARSWRAILSHDDIYAATVRAQSELPSNVNLRPPAARRRRCRYRHRRSGSTVSHRRRHRCRWLPRLGRFDSESRSHRRPGTTVRLRRHSSSTARRQLPEPQSQRQCRCQCRRRAAPG
jgi:hypothetical protein